MPKYRDHIASSYYAYRHGLGQTEAKDAIHTLKVRTVARGDASELGVCVVVAELYDVVSLVTLERRVIRVLQEELAVLDVSERLGLAGIEPVFHSSTVKRFL